MRIATWSTFLFFWKTVKTTVYEFIAPNTWLNTEISTTRGHTVWWPTADELLCKHHGFLLQSSLLHLDCGFGQKILHPSSPELRSLLHNSNHGVYSTKKSKCQRMAMRPWCINMFSMVYSRSGLGCSMKWRIRWNKMANRGQVGAVRFR